MPKGSRTRRQFLQYSALAAASAAAGCGSVDESPTPAPATTTSERESSTPTSTPTATPTRTPGPSATARQKLTASDGDTVVAGAIGESEPNGDDSGSTYAFDQSDGEWRQSLTIVPFTADKNDLVGAIVGVNEETVVAGAPSDEEPNGENAGSLYAYDRSRL